MNSFQPVSRATLSEQVASQIADMISSGHIKPGQKLPSENQLRNLLHVGRSTLREALKSLAFVGMVRTQPGKGVFVAEGPSKSVERFLRHGLMSTEKDVSDLVHARVLIETELAILCAQHRTDEDLQRLECLLSEMQRSVQGSAEEFVERDVEFHFAIAQGSQNRVLSQFLRTIRLLLKQYILLGAKQVPGATAVAVEEHRKVFEAIKQGNPRQARAAMQRHLRTFRTMLKALESEAPPLTASETSWSAGPDTSAKESLSR